VTQGVGPEFKPQYAKKKKKRMGAGRVAQVVESLPSKCEGLEFKPQYHKKEKKRKQWDGLLSF
jgi:hypothetical protein